MHEGVKPDPFGQGGKKVPGELPTNGGEGGQGGARLGEGGKVMGGCGVGEVVIGADGGCWVKGSGGVGKGGGGLPGAGAVLPLYEVEWLMGSVALLVVQASRTS